MAKRIYLSSVGLSGLYHIYSLLRAVKARMPALGLSVKDPQAMSDAVSIEAAVCNGGHVQEL